jgi:hypothetical protein
MKKVIQLSLLCLVLSGASYAQTEVKKSNPSKMKQYSLLVRVPLTYTSEQAKSVNPLWEKLLEEWKRNGAYVISFVFPGESYTVSGTNKIVKQEVVVSDNLRVVSNIVLQATDMTAALELASQCPVLLYGGKIEIREIPNPILVD